MARTHAGGRLWAGWQRSVASTAAWGRRWRRGVSGAWIANLTVLEAARFIGAARGRAAPYLAPAVKSTGRSLCVAAGEAAYKTLFGLARAGGDWARLSLHRPGF